MSSKRITIIGLGYVGLPLAVEFGKKYDTVGFDIDKSRILALQQGEDKTLETTKEELASSKKLTFSSDIERIKTSNVYIVTVPTPVNQFKAPDLTPLLKASEMLGKILKKGDIVIYESTVYPGCTEEDCVPVLEKQLADNYFTELIPAKDELMFEFYRNKEFFEGLLVLKLNISKPSMSLLTRKSNVKLPNKYALLFIGASAKRRKWAIENFINVGQYLTEAYGYELVICGGHEDVSEGKLFEEAFGNKCKNLVGQTSLFDLLQVIQNAEVLISNETSVPHFAVGLSVKNIFVIYAGEHMGRFTPYPKSVSNAYHAVFHPLIIQNIEKYEDISNTKGYVSNLDINEITSEQVITLVKSNINTSEIYTFTPVF